MFYSTQPPNQALTSFFINHTKPSHPTHYPVSTSQETSHVPVPLYKQSYFIFIFILCFLNLSLDFGSLHDQKQTSIPIWWVASTLFSISQYLWSTQLVPFTINIIISCYLPLFSITLSHTLWFIWLYNIIKTEVALIRSWVPRLWGFRLGWLQMGTPSLKCFMVLLVMSLRMFHTCLITFLIFQYVVVFIYLLVSQAKHQNLLLLQYLNHCFPFFVLFHIFHLIFIMICFYEKTNLFLILPTPKSYY